jgi:hypothetical protein
MGGKEGRLAARRFSRNISILDRRYSIRGEGEGGGRGADARDTRAEHISTTIVPPSPSRKNRVIRDYNAITAPTELTNA